MARIGCSMLAILAASWSASVPAAGPVVYWSSDPVAVGQAVVAIGDGLGETPKVEEGKGVALYCNGVAIARRDHPAKRQGNQEPLVLGREAWDGAHNGHQPCFYQGLMDEVSVWARPLSSAEVQAEFATGNIR